MIKVALMGTCNDTDWRDKLIPLLKTEYFNPVISDRDWTEEDRQNEILQRQTCEYVVHVLTPRMTGLFSIAEVTDDSNKRPGNTIFYVQEKDTNEEGKTIAFNPRAKRSIDAISDLVKANGAKICYSLQEIADFVNAQIPEEKKE